VIRCAQFTLELRETKKKYANFSYLNKSFLQSKNSSQQQCSIERDEISFRRVTSPDLQHLGEIAIGVWANICGGSGSTLRGEKFRAVSTEMLFRGYLREKSHEMSGWGEYIQKRYGWVAG